MKRMRSIGWLAALGLACGGGSDRGGSSADGSGSLSETAADQTSSDTADDDSDTDPTTGASGSNTKFDLGTIPDGDPPCGGGDLEFSYIWIANSSQGTVSKINTVTKVEEGRYTTGPVGGTDPSRTSVNLDGDVAVVNRMGGITKIIARPENCTDQNNDNMVTTSTGPNDVLPWGQDDCAAWNTALPAASRPAAWTSGDENGEDGCGNKVFIDAKVWSSAPNGFTGAWVYLLDGETGQIDNQVMVPGAAGSFGIYGGAVDPDNDFWGVVWNAGPLVHVRIADLTFEVIQLPIGSAYGFTVDAEGRSWVGGWDGNLQRYDPTNQQWTTVVMPGTYTSLSRGMMEDANGHLWAAALGGAGGGGILRVDTETATFVDYVDSVALGVVGTPTGASIDVDGDVWMVDQSKLGGGAFVLDPDSYQVSFVPGLQGPYTYSDMTGWALKNVAKPSG